MIHRGTQYSRAIRHFVKKTGRYPTRLEELENTNNIRFLRKRYKDPITGKDFKLLHVGEVQLTGAAGTPGLGMGGAIPAARPGAGATASASAPGQPVEMMAGAGAPVHRRLDPCNARRGQAAGEPMQPTIRDGAGKADAATPNQSSDPSGNDSKTGPGNPGGKRQIIRRGFWRRPDCRRRQHQQGPEYSRVQSQESLQRLAVHLRSDHGSQHGIDHHTGTASAAGVGSDEQNSSGSNSGQVLTPRARPAALAACRVRRRPSLPAAAAAIMVINASGNDGRDARPPFT